MIAVAAITGINAKGTHLRNITDNGETQIAHGFYCIFVFSNELLKVLPPERCFAFLLLIATGWTRV
jgi:hypothetical protein